MGTEPSALVDDLVTESAALHGILDQFGPVEWGLPTAATGWCLGDHVSHLAYFDETTLQSLVDPDRFRRDAELLTAGGDDFPDRVAAEHRLRSGADLMGWFRDARAALVSAYRGVDPLRRLPWYGPDMSPASSITARLMETWAHGQDIVDALGMERAPSSRLRHIAHLGIRALPYSFSRQSPPASRGAGPGRAEGTERGRMELGTHRRRRPCHGGRRGFLSRGDATEAPRRYRPGRDRSDCAAVDRARASIRRSSRTRAATAASQRFHGRERALQRGGERFRVTIPTIKEER